MFFCDGKMPFGGSCCCSRHQEWHHSPDVAKKDLRSASFYEEMYCTSDSKHEGRKRKICLACRGRIEVEEKWRKLENSADPSTSVVHEVSQLTFYLLLKVYSFWFEPGIEFW